MTAGSGDAAGPRAARPVRQFVLKIHSRCDLACDHCYMYEHADQSWRGRPPVMDVPTIERAAGRIADHASRHGLTEVRVILHGGEPLLAGPERLDRLITSLRNGLEGVCDTDLRLQTNGVLLDGRACAVFREHGVKVGVSLDGDRAANDRHRRHRDGTGSYDQAARAIDLLRGEFPDLYAGLLCTIDIANDPIAVYEALLAHEPPTLDFLLPHHTWDRPPPRTSGTAYAEWLIAIADRWFADGRPVPVRTFDSIISTGRGGPGLTESLGLEPVDLLVIETDGAYEQADSLKAAYSGAPGTGTDVFRHSIDEAAGHPGVAARQGGLSALCPTCRSCPAVATCGGGLYAHRYRGDGSGFANPSVYCPDLLALIDHVQAHTAGPPAATLASLATGYGGAAEIASLKLTQAIARRSLLAAIGGRTAPSAAWDVLRTVDGARPDALDAVLAHPFVRARMADWMRAAGTGGDDGTAPAAHGMLASIGCAAAARAGMRGRLTVPVRDGAVFVPSFGRFPAPGGGTAVVEFGDGRVSVVGAKPMEPVRYLSAGGFRVMLDDLDPYRDRYGWPVADRLDGERFAAWNAAFERAWELAEARYGEYAAAIAAGLTTIVPLAGPHDPAAASDLGRPVRPERPGGDVSASARDAFGAVGVALPDGPATLCLLLLHEFQHVKLGAVLDFADLYDVTERRTFPVPWRPDPRPLGGLLQGAYAHIAVTEFWCRRSGAPQPAVAADALDRFVRWRGDTVDAVATLQDSGALTGLGEQFAAGMRATLESMRPPGDPALSDRGSV